MNLIEQLNRQAIFSEKTFGPGMKTESIIAHIKKELLEVEKDPKDLMEWIDIILLAADGARRAGYTAEEIAFGIVVKQAIVENRVWPDWRDVPDGQPIEHIRVPVEQE